ncbi:tetratricopeptide repeat protein [Bradyrhizobium sp. WSM3983]|uniref:tetratricopeptide repeat protein n=1 Tax=Bradyrhizobium sp. WSM3983 TaxID=1038867 RepID=UPI00042A3656|nr:tetratricopeptide repeat protein [Bradyrhizobium sp. WSM3983]
MKPAARIVALHGALWSIDPWYRWSWYAWPTAMAVLITGWILISKPVNTGAWGNAGAWAKPIAQRATTTAPATPIKTTTVNPVDLEVMSCFANRGESSESACTKVIDDGKISGSRLASVYTQRGFMRRDKQPDSAISDFNAALKIQPDYAPALNDRAWIYMNRGDYDAALLDLNKSASPTTPWLQAAVAYYYRGFAYLRQKEYAKALSDLNEAIRRQANNADYYLARGEAQQAQENYDAALRDFDEFGKRAPKDPRGLLARAVIFETTGKPRDALAALESAVTLAPDNDFARSERDRLRGQVKDNDPAKSNPGELPPT